MGASLLPDRRPLYQNSKSYESYLRDITLGAR
jgi:hypothetical protein